MAKVKKFDAWTVLFLAVPALYALLLFYPLFESLQPSGVNALIIAFDRRPMVLVGTVFIMMVALCIRRISYIIRSSVATFQQIPLTIEETVISFGCTKLEAFFKVTVITEMSTAIILYNLIAMTLTLAICTQVSRGSDGPAAALAAILILLTIIFLLIFMKV